MTSSTSTCPSPRVRGQAARGLVWGRRLAAARSLACLALGRSLLAALVPVMPTLSPAAPHPRCPLKLVAAEAMTSGNVELVISASYSAASFAHWAEVHPAVLLDKARKG